MAGHSVGEKHLPVQNVKLRQILAFFLPLGLSALLVSLSHLIINSTLSRSPNAQTVIAGYTIAMSIFTITERPAVFLRQTCSALAADRTAFRAIAQIAVIILLFTLGFGFIISYTQAGELLFRSIYNTSGELLDKVLEGYRILFFVTVFSAIRCLFHGIIIRNMHTKWMTIGMIVRLMTMYGLAFVFLIQPERIGAGTGAWIFLAGMVVEALVSALEGCKIWRSMPVRAKGSSVRTVKDVIPFYRPLILTAFISVIIAPAVNSMLGKTVDIELAIASYAVALSLVNTITGFYTYVHQIVLNFYKTDSAAVRRFAWIFNIVPAILIALIAFTGPGEAILKVILGTEGELLKECRRVLGVFILFALVFPWVDYHNGLTMLHKKTSFMIYSQMGNVAVTVMMLIVLTAWLPSWNGIVGALAQSCGVAGELFVLMLLLRRLDRAKEASIAGRHAAG